MGGERAGLGVLESPTQPTVDVLLCACPPGARPDRRETHVLCVFSGMPDGVRVYMSYSYKGTVWMLAPTR
jgi:hypothetical protein